VRSGHPIDSGKRQAGARCRLYELFTWRELVDHSAVEIFRVLLTISKLPVSVKPSAIETTIDPVRISNSEGAFNV
jgi:hypothetical protein